MSNIKAHDDFLGSSVFFSELEPDAGELGVGRPTLANDSSVPPGVVVLEAIPNEQDCSHMVIYGYIHAPDL